jgi:gas vesicle protein
MSMISKIAKFGLGIVAGGAIGAAVGTLTAPEEGDSLRRKLKMHFVKAKEAGDDAKATKQAQLITRFRKDVGDFDALEDEIDHRLSKTDAVLAMGLGLNAPGAIASQQAALRDTDD